MAECRRRRRNVIVPPPLSWVVMKNLIRRAYIDIEKMYPGEGWAGNDPFVERAYHNITHTHGVVWATDKILGTMSNDPRSEINARGINLGCLIAACHDIDQRQGAPTASHISLGGQMYTKEMRHRFVGLIEENSVEILLGRMCQENMTYGTELFTEEDMRIAREAILATVPGFDPELGTVIQPNLSEGASFITHALALADLHAAMMRGGAAFLADGNAVFREENIDVARTLLRSPNISQAEKDFICERIMAWYRMQIRFAEGRKIVVQKQLLWLPETMRDPVMNLFKFDRAIAAARKRVKSIDAKVQAGYPPSFEEMVLSMGYTVIL
ncbi:MAG: hypothetical protein KGI50_01100 [Patescibacteria group bacterium]|nr:hypothetical protein [Patescibacteria group bacterium]MDE2438051.1 hypothetical protein [Patescibacteria group bacterium]